MKARYQAFFFAACTGNYFFDGGFISSFSRKQFERYLLLHAPKSPEGDFEENENFSQPSKFIN
jgi:hypothetical protein